MLGYYLLYAKVICFDNAADLEKSQHQRVSELQRLRSMYVIYVQRTFQSTCSFFHPTKYYFLPFYWYKWYDVEQHSLVPKIDVEHWALIPKLM